MRWSDQSVKFIQSRDRRNLFKDAYADERKIKEGGGVTLMQNQELAFSGSTLSKSFKTSMTRVWISSLESAAPASANKRTPIRDGGFAAKLLLTRNGSCKHLLPAKITRGEEETSLMLCLLNNGWAYTARLANCRSMWVAIVENHLPSWAKNYGNIIFFLSTNHKASNIIKPLTSLT